MTPTEIEAERKKFEAWVSEKHNNGFPLRQYADEYSSATVFDMWQGWLARAELARKETT